jgi:hypothetical protein
MNKSFWLGRFEVSDEGESYLFRDILVPGVKILPKSLFRGLIGNELDRAFFAWGFLPICLNPLDGEITDDPKDPEDLLFWQFPARTEAAAYELHKKINQIRVLGEVFHCYIGLPWATFIDKKMFPEDLLATLKVRISGFSHALKALGVELRVHTICQHIYWKQHFPIWETLGVSDLWLPHLREGDQRGLSIELHPWHLFAANLEDSSRSTGLVRGLKPQDRPYLASFIGAHADHYLSTVRLDLLQLKEQPDFYIEVLDKWHFEEIVYQHQVAGRPLGQIDEAGARVHSYNAVLSQSNFALCPSGAGPNTIRLWEAMGLSSIPVILGVNPRMPVGGSLQSIDWEKITLKMESDQVGSLPQILRKMSFDEIKERQVLAGKAYAQVRDMTCF